MVGEFPELQGIMGGYYARAQGEPDAVADAVRDHYKPVGQGDDVPTAPVTVAVSLADKLDTLVGFFGYGLRPTGSKDPFALRRAAIAILQLIDTNATRMRLRPALFRLALANYQSAIERSYFDRFAKVADAYGAKTTDEKYELLMHLQAAGEPDVEFEAIDPKVVTRDIIDFLIDRLKVQQREAGVRHDLIDAVFALGGEDDLVLLLRRVKALQAFVATQEGADLLAGYKRAANILKSSPSLLGGAAGVAEQQRDRPQGGGGAASAAGALSSAAPPSSTSAKAMADATSPSKLGEDLGEAESALLAALDTAEPLAASAIEAEDFEGAMAALASLRAPIDAFFDGVMVNDPDPEKRAYRLGLLTRFRDAVTQVADFSRIEG